jgi:phage host-nuclease inhibitor protein Gam
MASLEDKVHDRFATGLADSRFQPAVAALNMQRENKYVNESLIQYMTNYVIQMADMKTVPMHLVEVQAMCKALKISLTELGLTGETRTTGNEYLVV